MSREPFKNRRKILVGGLPQNSFIETDNDYPRQYIAFQFYSDASLQNPVVPTSGATVTVTGKLEYLEGEIAPPNSVVDVTTPTFLRLDGPTARINLSFSNIDPTWYCQAIVNGYSF